MNNVLVLNSAFMPISIVSWQDAIILWYREKVEILSSYKKNFIHSPSFCMEKPSVIRLLNFVRPRKKVIIYKPFTRRNVHNRDDGVCQYCGIKTSFSKFTIDHVIPKAAGGLSNWKNCVCSCEKCNARKADKSLAQAGMKLLRKPFAPKIANSIEEYTINKMRELKSIPHQDWYTYLQWLKKN